jgi:hypothetical protein
VLLAGLVSLGLFIWNLIPCVGWLSGTGMLLYFSFVVVQLLVPVVVLEKRGPLDALRRAWELARGRFWWLLGLTCILYLLRLLLLGPTTLVSYLLQFVLTSTGYTINLALSQTIVLIVQSLVVMLGTLVYYPLQLTVVVLTYFDLRVRSEGYDLAMQSMNSAEHPDLLDAIAAVPAAPRRASLITGMEIGYFVAGTLGGFLVIVLVYGTLMATLIGVSSLFLQR